MLNIYYLGLELLFTNDGNDAKITENVFAIYGYDTGVMFGIHEQQARSVFEQCDVA